MAVGDAYMFPGFLTPVLTQSFFPKPPTTFSHASAEVRGENTPERKVASTGDRTHNHQVMSPTGSPLSHPGGAAENVDQDLTAQNMQSDLDLHYPISRNVLFVFKHQKF